MMARARRPVSVAGIEFDALISSDHKLEATVPQYATENGFMVSDTILLGEESLSMVLYLTDTPVTWYNRHGANNGRVKSVCAKLEELYYSAEPVTVITTDKTYTEMAIESITIKKSLDEGYAREIPISFRKIRRTKTKTTTIPASYGKSGTTETSTGTANTSSGSSSGSSSKPASSGSSAKPASSGSSAKPKPSSGSSSSSGGSILHGIGQSLGIIK